jgi:hypothetical protein
MKFRCHLSFKLLFGFFLISLHLFITRPIFAAQNKALVIGISQYTEINSLRYADSDALEFSQILTDLAGYDNSDVSILINQQATKKRIVDEINKIVRMSEKIPLDNFILMFAGHGIESTMIAHNASGGGGVKDTNIFLAPSDASTEANNFYSTGNGKEISNETFINKAWLARQLSAIKSKSIFIILDSCYSGTKSFGALFLENEGYEIQNFGATSSKKWVADVQKRALTLVKPTDEARPLLVAKIKNRKIAYLASNRDDQTSAEYDELQHGALSYSIFEYIKRVRRDVFKGDKKDVSIEEVYANVSKVFSETKVRGSTLDTMHQPLLIPIPDFTNMKDMVLLSVPGTKERVTNVVRKAGILNLISDRTDVEIYVDGLERKNAINTQMELPEGRHSIELFLPRTGYRYTFTADISSTAPISKNFLLSGELEVASFWLKENIKSPGPQLDVYIDGEKLGKSPFRLNKLVAGSHLIEVKYKDVKKSRHVEIRPNSPLRINYSIIHESAPAEDEQKINNVVF